MPHDPHYDSARHKAWREKVLRKSGYLCEECKRYGRMVSASHAHHIKPRSTYPELAFDVGNGMALCTRCHNKIEPRYGTPPPLGRRF